MFLQKETDLILLKPAESTWIISQLLNDFTKLLYLCCDGLTTTTNRFGYKIPCQDYFVCESTYALDPLSYSGLVLCKKTCQECSELFSPSSKPWSRPEVSALEQANLNLTYCLGAKILNPGIFFFDQKVVCLITT